MKFVSKEARNRPFCSWGHVITFFLESFNITLYNLKNARNRTSPSKIIAEILVRSLTNFYWPFLHKRTDKSSDKSPSIWPLYYLNREISDNLLVAKICLSRSHIRRFVCLIRFVRQDDLFVLQCENSHCQQEDVSMNESGNFQSTINIFVIIKNKLMSVFHASVLLLTMNFLIKNSVLL